MGPVLYQLTRLHIHRPLATSPQARPACEIHSPEASAPPAPSNGKIFTGMGEGFLPQPEKKIQPFQQRHALLVFYNRPQDGVV